MTSSILDDPAFSSDPRSHPHYPLPIPIPITIPPSSRMNAIIRRPHNNLDRIDELDESDPFGASYHHDGPYEAIATNPLNSITQPASPRTREFLPRSLHPSQHNFVPRAPFVPAEKGLSLRLEPGQILQHNTIYTSHASSVPNQSSLHSNTIVTQPRGQSVRNPPRSRSFEDSSLHDLHNQPSLFPHASPERYIRDNNAHNVYPLGRDTAPHQSEITIIPPPRHESRLHISGPSRSPPSIKSMPRKTQATESTIPALPPHDSRHKTIHSLGSLRTTNTTISSINQNKSLELPRIRHLPKHLVMPAPLQPQLQPLQPQHGFPSTVPVASQDEYPDHHALESARFEGQLAMYTQGPKLLRKKSFAFPEKLPISHHVPAPHDDPIPIIAATANESEGTKEKIRRRRLSKRRSDI